VRAARFPDGPGLLLAGDAATRLEQLVSRLSLEPGIHAVHWHTADDPSPCP
jgi:putative Mg2+ transporter-C (MgtC) family protein